MLGLVLWPLRFALYKEVTWIVLDCLAAWFDSGRFDDVPQKINCNGSLALVAIKTSIGGKLLLRIVLKLTLILPIMATIGIRLQLIVNLCSCSGRS